MFSISLIVPDCTIIVDGQGRACNIDDIKPYLNGFRAVRINELGESFFEKEPGAGDNEYMNEETKNNWRNMLHDIWKEAAPEPAKPFSVGTHIAWVEQALIEIGKLDDVEAAVAASSKATQSLWRRAQTLLPTDPEVAGICAFLGIDAAELFRRAEDIRRERGTR